MLDTSHACVDEFSFYLKHKKKWKLWIVKAKNLKKKPLIRFTYQVIVVVFGHKLTLK